MLYEGAVICVSGTVSIREDEDSKILVNHVAKVPKEPDDVQPESAISQSLTSNNKPNVYSDSTKQGRESLSDATSLYLKVDKRDGELFTKAKRLIEIFDGSTPVFFYLSENKKVLKAPRELWVSLNDVLISELKNQIGEDSVKLKYKES